MSSDPVHRRHAPAVTRRQSREAVLRSRSGEVVSYAPLVLEELGRDHGADGVAADVCRSCATATIAKEASQRVRAARFQVAIKNVAFCHWPSMAHAGGSGSVALCFARPQVPAASGIPTTYGFVADKPRSVSVAWAVLRPGRPLTLPPGWAVEPVR